MRISVIKNATAVLVVALAACGGGQKTGTETDTDTGTSTDTKPNRVVATPATLDEQLTLGARLYEDECAGCHGSDGAGKKSAPAIMGTKALPQIPPAGALRRTVPFNTAHDVLVWTAEAMPSSDPGSLEPAEYEAIIAHQLTVLGIDLKGQPLTAASAADVKLR